MSRRVGLNIEKLENNIKRNEQMLEEAEKKRMNAEKKRLEMEKVLQMFLLYTAAKRAEEKARVEMEKAKRESNRRTESKAKSKIKTASEKITKILANGKEVADLFFKLASIWTKANNTKKRKSVEADAKNLANKAKKAEEKARKVAENEARYERLATRRFLRGQAEKKQREQAESNAKRKAEANAKKQAEANAKKQTEANAKKQAEAEANAKRQAEEDQRRKQKYANSNNVYKEAIQKLQIIKSSRMLPKKEKLKQGRKVFIKASLTLHPNKGGKEELFKNLSSYYNNFEKM